MSQPTTTIRDDPPVRTWPRLVRRGTLGEQSSRVRNEIGLPTDRPVVMTGHQPIFWHPGVLAKYLAASATAERIGGACAWLVVDQDDVDPLGIDAPVRDARGALTAGTIRFGEERSPSVPPSVRDAIEPGGNRADVELALPALRNRVESIRGALRARADARTLAKQVVRANLDLLGDLIPDAPIVYASELNGTALFRELIEMMSSDPGRTVSAYNEAAREHPEAGIAPLRMDLDEDLFELPLWSIESGRERRRVYAHDLPEIDPSTLSPRALMVTLLVRLAGCDLFVHGTGGASYDRVTESWARGWLGRELAPSVSITADLTLPLHERSVDESDVADARWRAHSARHNPALLGDESAQREKESLLESIAESRSRGEDPAPQFRKLHEDRERHESAHADELRALDERAAELARLFSEREIAQRRDWPSVLYGTDPLRALNARIRDAIDDGKIEDSGAPALSRSR